MKEGQEHSEASGEKSERSAPISIGVIGAGTITQSIHLTSLYRAGFDIAMVCDLSPSRAADVARRCGARPTSDTAEVFSSDVDAVLIATPGSHANLTAQAIKAGKHVLAEKPLAYTVAEVAELEQLADDHDVVVQVGYMKMFDPIMAKAKEQYDSLEEVRLVQVTVMHPADEPQVEHLRMGEAPRDADVDAIAQAEKYERDHVELALPDASDELRAYYANVLNGSVIHEFSVLRALGVSLPDQWEAQAVTPLGGPAPATLLATGVKDQTAVVLSWNWLPEYPEYAEQIWALAANGRFRLNMAKPYLVEERSSLDVETNVDEMRSATTYTGGNETGFLRQLDAFREAILRGEVGIAGLDDARQDITQLQKLAKSIARSQGQDITVEVDK